MCGVSGFIDFEYGVTPKVLENMTNTIRHRGPDDEGYALLSNEKMSFYSGEDTVSLLKETMPNISTADAGCMGLGFRRLAILDITAAGHQPMERFGRTIVFNGEIYNYLELREELKKENYTFATETDTEVILAAYDFWGIDCLQHFNGMWAFALYDQENQTLTLSRDRFGVKPLYYYKNGSLLLFASEIKQLFEDSRVSKKANAKIISQYLLYGLFDHSEETFFEGIYQLRGGHIATIKIDTERRQLQDFAVSQYYSIFDLQEQGAVADSAELVGAELTRSINWRLRSDVKMGSCLSGGLDSSSIVAIACDELKKQAYNVDEFETVSSSFKKNSEIDETKYSSAVVNHCHCRENLVSGNVQELEEALASITWHQDEPTSGFLLMQWKVFEKAASLGCKVMLDGQGGDETLGGYNPYYGVHLYTTLRHHGLRSYIKELKQCVQNSGMSYYEALAYTFYFNIVPLRIARLKMKRLPNLGAVVHSHKDLGDYIHCFKPTSGLHQQKLDFTTFSLPGILHWNDRNAMAHSLEIRLPFLDYQFVSSAFSIPLTDKISSGYTKIPLRNFIKDKLPEDVVWRKQKLGFPVPAKEWIYTLDQAYILRLLENSKSAPFFNIAKLKKAYLKRNVDIPLFTKFVLTELWMRVFDVAV